MPSQKRIQENQDKGNQPKNSHRLSPHTRSYIRSHISISIGISTLLLADMVFQISPAAAEISGDGSFGTLVNLSERAACTALQCTITGGTLNSSKSSLFHSFEQFSIPGNTGSQSAQFVDPGVNDIIVRVTGDRSSLINGLLSARTAAGTSSNANLFLLNTQGIRFGPNAQLDLGGNFTASTANEILFDGKIAIATSAATPPSPSLLTVSTPICLGFFSNTGAPPSSGAITVQGTGNLLTTGSPTAPGPFVNRLFRDAAALPPNFPPVPPLSELAVQPGKVITLIGNGISLSGGNITATGGQINLGSIESGQILFSADTGKDSGFDATQVDQYSDITLNERSSLEASNPQSDALSPGILSPGDIFIRGRNITLDNGSIVLAETLPTANPIANPATITSGGSIDIAATEQIILTDNPREAPYPGAPPFLTIASQLSENVAPGATGPGGEITVSANNLTLDNGGKIEATTFGSGNAGRLNIEITDAIDLTGGGAIGPSGIFSVSEASATGDAGLIDITTNRLSLQQGGSMVTSSASTGASGSIRIAAEWDHRPH